jgi:hypothetical protein
MEHEDCSREEPPPNLDNNNSKLRTFIVTGELVILKVDDKVINIKSMHYSGKR